METTKGFVTNCYPYRYLFVELGAPRLNFLQVGYLIFRACPVAFSHCL